MTKYAAHYLFPGNQAPIYKGVITLDSTGLVIDIGASSGNLQEEAKLEFHNGILCPAFVHVLEVFESDRFYRKFPVLTPFKELQPQPLKTDKELLNWLIAIQRFDKQIRLEQLITLFTFEAAKLIHAEKKKGSLSPGKRPGLMLISGMDYQELRLNNKSYLKVLV